MWKAITSRKLKIIYKCKHKQQIHFPFSSILVLLHSPSSIPCMYYIFLQIVVAVITTNSNAALCRACGVIKYAHTVETEE